MSSSILQVFSNVYQTTKVIFEYLLDFYCHCGAQTGISKCVLAFGSLCGARRGVAKCVLAFNNLCGARMGVAKRVLAFDSLCGAGTGVAKQVLAFDSFCRARTGVSLRQSLWRSNRSQSSIVSAEFERGLENVYQPSTIYGLAQLYYVYSVSELCYYRSNFRTISLIVRTPPFP